MICHLSTFLMLLQQVAEKLQAVRYLQTDFSRSLMMKWIHICLLLKEMSLDLVFWMTHSA